ncbi:MAG: cation transporter [Clostridia bacterium]|nr:cation transporter [Clostridia bacterium]MBQ6905652.1 cation transporter [Clostridia bacterium]
MVALLSKFFIKDRFDYANSKVRLAYGTLCSVLGIFLNVVLFAIKMIAGTISGSIAVTADAFNNLSDAFSSFITLIGFKLADQKPDADHPFGHGRFEYISGFIVSGVILLMGFELIKSSIGKIISPESVEFGLVPAVILLVSVMIKLYMFFYNRGVGKKIDSASMKAVATDSVSDAIATSVVFISMIVGHFTSLAIDGYCGIAVAIFIFIAGFRTAKETIDLLLGQPPEKEFVEQIEAIVRSSPNVVGIHDLIVHNYGPGRVIISLHAEVPADGNILELHDEIDNVERTLGKSLGCEAVIHMDPIDTRDEKTLEAKEAALSAIRSIDERITLHDFRIVSGPTHTNLIFDVVIPFDWKLGVSETKKLIDDAVKKENEKYFTVVNIDRSYIS